MDGTVRVFSICKDGFALVQAMKPHTCMVKCLEYSPDGRFIASLGSDNTLFFFEVRNLDEHACPIGFIQLHTQVNHISWHARAGTALLSMEDGSIIELLVPTQSAVDNTETYLIEVSYRSVVPDVPELPDEDAREEPPPAEGEEGAEGEDGAEAED